MNNLLLNYEINFGLIGQSSNSTYNHFMDIKRDKMRISGTPEYFR